MGRMFWYYLDNLQGSHDTFSAKALDSAGNSSAIQTHSWVIDTQAPVVTLASQPSSITNNTSATFSWTANDIGGGQVDFFECSHDSTAFSRCSSPITLSDLHDGSHQFSIRATDTAGNRSNSISTSWTIDTTTPMASITSGPNSLSNLTSATFVFSANPPPDGNITGYECQLDSGAWSGCSSPKSYSNQTEGLHQFSVRSIDNFNRRSPSRTRSWTIDLTPPSLSLSSSINLVTQQTSVEFQFSGTILIRSNIQGYWK